MKQAFAKPKDNKIRKVQTPTAKRMRKELDLLLKNHIHERDGWKCVKCGNTTQLQSCHILPKGKYPRLRFEPDDLITMDWKCHWWAHKNPHEFVHWFDEKYPGRYERLQIAAACSPKLDVKMLLSFWRAGAIGREGEWEMDRADNNARLLVAAESSLRVMRQNFQEVLEDALSDIQWLGEHASGSKSQDDEAVWDKCSGMKARLEGWLAALPPQSAPFIALDSKLEPDFCVCDYRPRRKCSVHPAESGAGEGKS